MMMSCPINSLESNQVALRYAREECYGLLPATPEWKPLLINSYADTGTTFEKVMRDTINEGRQQQEGTTTAQTTAFGGEIDFTQKTMADFFEDAFFADWRYKTELLPTATTATAYTVASSTGIVANSLVFGEGFANAPNNGLKLVTAVTGTSVTVGGLTLNASVAAGAKVTRVGLQGAAGDLGITVAAGVTTLTSTALDFTTLGLIPGEWFYIGGDSAPAVFATAGNNGWVRTKTITATAIVLDRVSGVTATDTGATKTIRLFFGHVLKNEATVALIKEKSRTFERQFPSGEFQYISGCVLNTLELSLPTNAKITANVSYMGSDSVFEGFARTGVRPATLQENIFNTSSSFGSLRLLNDDTNFAYNNYLTSLSLTVNNGVTDLKALGLSGNIGANKANFVVEGTTESYFTSSALTTAVRNNDKLSLQMAFVERNAGWFFDVPRIQLGDAKSTVTKDQPITLPLGLMAVEHPTLNHTFLVEQFTYLPTVAKV